MHRVHDPGAREAQVPAYSTDQWLTLHAVVVYLWVLGPLQALQKKGYLENLFLDKRALDSSETRPPQSEKLSLTHESNTGQTQRDGWCHVTDKMCARHRKETQSTKDHRSLLTRRCAWRHASERVAHCVRHKHGCRPVLSITRLLMPESPQLPARAKGSELVMYKT